ncbi:MAG TPA: DUF1622 domain-containing protein [Mesorhizobium sp.]|jgi:uncharacterized membrane protein|nr:DUF1622 domain-containing protein [Mesorhizobium sp.]
MEQAEIGQSPHEAAHGVFDAALEWIALGLEAAGVAAILLGAVFAFATALPLLRAPDTRAAAYRAFRLKLGHAILLGLELLVAADIVGTVAVEATLDNLAVLAVIVLIRTFLSISLTVEVENRWPWQAEGRGRSERRGPGGEVGA